MTVQGACWSSNGEEKGRGKGERCRMNETLVLVGVEWLSWAGMTECGMERLRVKWIGFCASGVWLRWMHG